MKAWNIYLFVIKLKWNPSIFLQTNRGILLKLIYKDVPYTVQK